MLKQDKTQERIDRHHITQEDFTPECVLDMLCPPDDDPLYTDFTKTFCDPCAGIGNIFIYVLSKRLSHCSSIKQYQSALSSLYAVELMQDNVDEMKERIYKTLQEFSEKNNLKFSRKNFEKIINYNIVCSDFFKWDFDNWRPIKELKSTELF